jgi:hypothetical protein
MLTLVVLLSKYLWLDLQNCDQPASHRIPPVAIRGRPRPITWALPRHFAAEFFEYSICSVFAAGASEDLTQPRNGST